MGFDDEAGGDVFELDGGGGFVDLLATGAGAAEVDFCEAFFGDLGAGRERGRLFEGWGCEVEGAEEEGGAGAGETHDCGPGELVCGLMRCGGVGFWDVSGGGGRRSVVMMMTECR